MNCLLKNRAWIELDMSCLKNNIEQIKKVNNNIIAVVKANAYGHGIIKIASYLNKIGITFFAVATLDEGILLRKNKIKGKILILGYTSKENLKYVKKYNLIQTIIDYDYFIIIKDINFKINAHIKINTGMNRIGENYQNINNIIDMYKNNNICIQGIYTHLCVSDSNKESNITFTEKQLDNFNYVLNALKEKKINIGITHVLNSYGIFNYQNYKYDYIRCGILMYGIKNNNSYLSKNINLKPILKLKSRITSIRNINKNDSVSYGCAFIAKNKMKIASVSIGYADGIPRIVSNNYFVYVNNKKANIIGTICMDQLIIDITNIDAKIGDEVIIIKDNEHLNILANNANTISYEILTNLHSRLPRIIINK
ncbi:MAG: alanine racemase [Bacilli bacterium]